MDQIVNGVKVHELSKGANSLEEIVFQLVYKKEGYYNKRIKVDLLHGNIGLGPMWMFVIKEVPYAEFYNKHYDYVNVVHEINYRIMPYLIEKHGCRIDCCITGHIDGL